MPQTAGRALDLQDAVSILTRTPVVLDAWLRDLPDNWLRSNEGGETWSAFDVVGHLIHGEHTDWVPRARIIFEHGEQRPFDTFDREAQFSESTGKTISRLLDEFGTARQDSLRQLASLNITAADLQRRGTHPAFGAVTLGQLLATWVAHDLDHIAQIARVLAKQYSEAVGPWHAYLRVISGQPG